MYRTTVLACMTLFFAAPTHGDEVPEFATVIKEIVNARNFFSGYRIEYLLEKSDLAEASNVIYHGSLHVEDRGFRHEQMIVGGGSKIETVDAEIKNMLGQPTVTIATAGSLYEIGHRGRYGTWRPVTLGATREARPPFDPRSFGLALVGDMGQRWPLEVTAINLLGWDEPLTKWWVSDGVAGYDFDDYVVHVDTKRGFWPVFHQLVSRDKNGQLVVKSAARLVLAEIDGMYQPVDAEIWSDRTHCRYEIKWSSVPVSDELDPLNGKAAAERLSYPIR